MCIFRQPAAPWHSCRFHHYDLRTDNVMEHVPDPEQDASDPISLSMIGDAAQRCVFDGAIVIRGP